jgi:hypothetical protein
LTAAHQTWYEGSTAEVGEEEVPPLVNAYVIGGDRPQFHVMIDSKLVYLPKVAVVSESLALGGHDPSQEVPVEILPPGMRVDGSRIVVVDPAQRGQAQILAGQNDMARDVVDAPPVPEELAAEVVVPADVDQRRAQANRAGARALAPPVPPDPVEHLMARGFDQLEAQRRLQEFRQQVGPAGPWAQYAAQGGWPRIQEIAQGPAVELEVPLIDLRVQGPELPAAHRQGAYVHDPNTEF